MKIEILYVPGCPNLRPAADAVTRLLAAASLAVEISSIPVHSEVQAQTLRFPGSPTIRVNGNDVEPESASTVGLACRLYRNRSGIPGDDAIRRALAQAKGKE